MYVNFSVEVTGSEMVYQNTAVALLQEGKVVGYGKTIGAFIHNGAAVVVVDIGDDEFCFAKPEHLCRAEGSFQPGFGSDVGGVPDF